MNTAVVNVKVDPRVKKQAQMVAGKMGLSLSALINGFLRNLIKTKTVTFSAFSEEPTEYLLKSLKESREDIKAGRVVSFKNPQNALKYLDELIADEKRSNKINRN